MLVCPEGFFRVVVGTGCAASNAFVDWSWCLQGEIHRKLGGFDGNFHPNKTFQCFAQKTCSVDVLFVKMMLWFLLFLLAKGNLLASQGIIRVPDLGAARGI